MWQKTVHTTDIKDNAMYLADVHCIKTVPHSTSHWYVLYITVCQCTCLLS